MDVLDTALSASPRKLSGSLRKINFRIPSDVFDDAGNPTNHRVQDLARRRRADRRRWIPFARSVVEGPRAGAEKEKEEHIRMVIIVCVEDSEIPRVQVFVCR